MAGQLGGDKISAVLGALSNIVVKDSPRFDLESYIQNYSVPSKLDRLIFIGSHSVVLCVDSLKTAVTEAKKGRDKEKYLLSQQLLAKIAPAEPEAQYDQTWVETTNNRNAAETAKLEAELKQYKNNLVKDSIRLGNQDLGYHFMNIGDLSKAFDSFGRMRQDCTNGDQIIKVTKNIISVSMARNDWQNVQSNVLKLMATTPFTAESEGENLSYSKCVLGLAQLHHEKYHDAAGSFLSIESGLSPDPGNVMTLNDIAVYGAICALATMDSAELQRRVLDNSSFRTYLELESQLRKAVTLFVNSRYSQCLSILEGYRNDYLLDIHLSRHVKSLFDTIRSKSIVEYFIPFSCVTLGSLNDAFATPGGTMDAELIDMIKSGKLEARIDTQNKLLIAVSKSVRAELQNRTLARADTYEREMQRRVLRMNVIGAGLEVKSTKKTQGVPYTLPVAQDPRTPDGLDHDSGYEYS